MNNSEKRKHPRIRVKWPVTVLTDYAIIKAETRNITVNGIFISSSELLRLNQSFPLSINPPNREPMKVTGKVVWSDHHSVDNKTVPYGMGICFVKVSDKDRHFLEELISVYYR
jgi:Tfp pilus assembly protein PilZ